MQGVDEQERNVAGISHLAALRDLLDLPFHTLQEDQLRFALGAQHDVIVRSVDGRYLSLLCELGNVGRMSADDWRAIATRTASVYNPAHPASLLVLDDRLVLAWTCPVAMATEPWTRLAEDALTWAIELQALLERRPTRPHA